MRHATCLTARLLAATRRCPRRRWSRSGGRPPGSPRRSRTSPGMCHQRILRRAWIRYAPPITATSAKPTPYPRRTRTRCATRRPPTGSSITTVSGTNPLPLPKPSPRSSPNANWPRPTSCSKTPKTSSPPRGLPCCWRRCRRRKPRPCSTPPSRRRSPRSRTRKPMRPTRSNAANRAGSPTA